MGVSGENGKRPMRVGSKGFTVLEVLVTLGILGLILGMAVPRYVAVRQKAEARACQARRSLVERVIRVEQAENGNGSTGAVDAGKTFLETFPEGRCPGDGEIRLEGDRVICELHVQQTQAPPEEVPWL